MTYDEILKALGEEHFGVLAATSTAESVIYARNNPTSIGNLFLIPGDRRDRRVYVFRTTEYANVLRREDELDPTAKNLLVLDDPSSADVSESDKLLRLTGSLLGYSEETGAGEWVFRSPRQLPPHFSKVYKVGFGSGEAIQQQESCLAALLQGQLGHGVFVGELLAGERPLPGVRVSIPAEYFAHHLGIFGRTGAGKSNLLMVFVYSIYSNNRRLFALDRKQWDPNDRLVQHRNPCPQGKVRVQWLCHLNDPSATYQG